MSTLFLICARATPVLNKKHGEMLLRVGQILGIHGTNRRVALDSPVKHVYQLNKERFPAHLIEERFFHFDTLMASPTMGFLSFTEMRV